MSLSVVTEAAAFERPVPTPVPTRESGSAPSRTATSRAPASVAGFEAGRCASWKRHTVFRQPAPAPPRRVVRARALEALHLADVFDHLDELVDGISLSASELDELSHFLDDGAALGCPGNRDSASAS